MNYRLFTRYHHHQHNQKESVILPLIPANPQLSGQHSNRFNALTVGKLSSGLAFVEKEVINRTDVTREEANLNLNWIKNLNQSDMEPNLASGLIHLYHQRIEQSIQDLEKSENRLSAKFSIAFIEISRKNYDKASKYLTEILGSVERGEKYFRDHQDHDFYLILPVTKTVTTVFRPSMHSLQFGLGLCRQALGDYAGFLKIYKSLLVQRPDDIMIKEALGEILYIHKKNKNNYQKIIEYAENVPNKTSIHGSLLFFAALSLIKMNDIERSTALLTEIMRKKANRDPELLQHARYYRAYLYRRTNQQSRATSELNILYLENPHFKDHYNIFY